MNLLEFSQSVSPIPITEKKFISIDESEESVEFAPIQLVNDFSFAAQK